jgi:hypothetical protein
VAHRGRQNADECLALALAGGASVRDAAAGIGIAERTAFRRLEDPAFRQRVGELRREMVTAAMGRLADGMSDAAAELRRLALGAASEPVRLGACRAILELGVRLPLAEAEAAGTRPQVVNVQQRIETLYQQILASTPPALPAEPAPAIPPPELCPPHTGPRARRETGGAPPTCSRKKLRLNDPSHTNSTR